MKGFRFYKEVTPLSEEGFGSVFALSLEYYPSYIEGFCGVLNVPNSPVNWSGASEEYLRKDCKRISEFEARRIHPEVFSRLDEGENDDDLTLTQRKHFAWSSIITHRFSHNPDKNKWIQERLKKLRIAVKGYNTIITDLAAEPPGFDERVWSLNDFMPM